MSIYESSYMKTRRIGQRIYKTHLSAFYFVITTITVILFTLGCSGNEAATPDNSGQETEVDRSSDAETARTSTRAPDLSDFTCSDDGTSLPGGPCEDNAEPGVFAIRLDIPVYWMPKSLLGIEVVDSGRGVFRYYGKVVSGDICENGEYAGSLYTCGLQLPTFFSTLLCEAYETEFPNAAWDRDIEPIPVIGSITGYAPGDVISMNPMDIVFGIDLKDSRDKWPSADEAFTFTCPSGSGKECFPDYDLDDKPGITLISKGAENDNATEDGCIDASGGNKPFKRAYIPLSADVDVLTGGGARANEMYIGFQMINAGGEGEIGNDCKSGSGAGSGDEINARAAGCQVKEGSPDLLGNPAGPNTPCGDEQANFFDNQMPVFVPLNKGEAPPAELNLQDNSVSEGAIASIVRLGNADQSYSCADIRNAPFPEAE